MRIKRVERPGVENIKQLYKMVRTCRENDRGRCSNENT